jgi:hypothetical protein
LPAGRQVNGYPAPDAFRICRLVDHAYGRTFEATTLALSVAEGDVEKLPRLDLLRAIIETYLEIIVAGENVEERAVVVMGGATFPSGSDLPAMTRGDQETHQVLARTIREGQREGSIRPAADPARVRELCGQTITAILGLPPRPSSSS